MQRDMASLQSQAFDMLIVGGGVHGAWSALRAAQAGYRVALIERDDFGAATSANSLKILHGGLRYLQHLDFARMRVSIKARREFARQLPRFVRPLPCVMSLQATGLRSPWIFGPALLANDVLSADRNRGVLQQARLPNGKLLSKDSIQQQLAHLTDATAIAGGQWWDALAVDAARLVLEPLLMASHAGAVVANQVQALEYRVSNHKIEGVTALDRQSGRSFDIKAAVVIDATGPGCQQLLGKHGVATALPKAWIGGLNIVLKRSLGIDVAVALSSASKSADHSAIVKRTTRDLFFVPWRGVTMIGTDYVAVNSADAATPPRAAIEKFVVECARVAPRANLSMADVALVHWGLLPLDEPGTLLPRKSPVLVSGRGETGIDGLVVVVGEKLTSAPVLSQAVLRHAQLQLQREAVGRPLESMHSQEYAEQETESREIHPETRTRLLSRYGEQWLSVATLARTQPEWLLPIQASSEVRGVEIIHAIRNEMALSLEDLVLRRLDIGDRGHPGMEALRRCAVVAAPELGWSDRDIHDNVARLDGRFKQVV